MYDLSAFYTMLEPLPFQHGFDFRIYASSDITLNRSMCFIRPCDDDDDDDDGEFPLIMIQNIYVYAKLTMDGLISNDVVDHVGQVRAFSI